MNESRRSIEHPNVLWYATYDDQCKQKNLTEVNFNKYIALVRMDSSFQLFQARIMEKVSTWSNKLISLFNILEASNEFFDPDLIDTRLLYIEDKNLRTALVSFQLWILCERFYCLLFYSLDTQEFANDRCMATLTRIFKFFNQLLSQYQFLMFQQNAVKTFLNRIKQQMMSFQKSLSNRWATILCNEVLNLLYKFVGGREKLGKKDYRQEAYLIIIKEIHQKNNDNIEEIEEKLMRTYEKKEILLKINEKKRWDNLDFVDGILDEAKKTYDPKLMIEEERLRLEKEAKKPRRRLETVQKNPISDLERTSQRTREKNSIGSKIPYKKIIHKSVNNPLTSKNNLYNTFVHDLVIGEEQKKQNEKRLRDEKKLQSEGESQDDIEFFVYYTQGYQKKIRNIPSDCARVTEFDIATNIPVDQKEVIDQQDKALGKVMNGNWTYYDQDEQGWHRNVYGEISKQKYTKILLLDNDDEEGETRTSFMKFVAQEMVLQRGRQQAYQEIESPLNIPQLTYQSKKSAWNILRSLHNKLRISNQLDRLQTAPPFYVYPWTPEFMGKKSAIL